MKKDLHLIIDEKLFIAVKKYCIDKNTYVSSLIEELIKKKLKL